MTSEVNFRDALKLALKEAMASNPRLVVLGQDVSGKSLSRLTTGLAAVYGEHRIRDCPISESAMVGFAVGAAMRGYTTLIEIAYADIAAVCFSSLVHSAAKLPFITNGRMACPVVLRAPIARFSRHGPMGCELTASWFYNVPDINIAMPSTADEAYWCMRTALSAARPTLFYDDRALHGTSGQVRDRQAAPETVERARLTVIAAGRLAALARNAASKLPTAGKGEINVLSLGLIKPLPRKAILDAAARSERILILQDEPPYGGYGPAVRCLLDEAADSKLKAPPRLVCREDTFLPYKWEEDGLLSEDQVGEIMAEML